ncbi:MAG: thiamine pyrophosphate-binding protein [Acetobacteraceae bacterium]|nr:thiamine pyrophosphate-binding protein [Acetobacteraceae bacterium]
MTQVTGMVTVRQAVIELLRSLGMTTVFGNPGSTELPFLDRWPADFRYVLGLQEASVVGMADGYARATGNAAFVSLHSAAGVGHALGNVFTAYRNQAPMVITAGQQARALLPNLPFLGASEAASFPKPYVKYSIEPARAEDVPGAIAHAYHIARCWTGGALRPAGSLGSGPARRHGCESCCRPAGVAGSLASCRAPRRDRRAAAGLTGAWPISTSACRDRPPEWVKVIIAGGEVA